MTNPFTHFTNALRSARVLMQSVTAAQLLPRLVSLASLDLTSPTRQKHVASLALPAIKGEPYDHFVGC